MAFSAVSQIADFADQDHVGVVPQDAAQRRGERQADLGMDLDLVDAFELILDRVFDRDDLDVVALDFEQRAVERGRLAGAGGAGDQHDAVRQSDQLAERLVHVARPCRCFGSENSMRPLSRIRMTIPSP